jgi:peptide/nickel transport system permease protein
MTSPRVAFARALGHSEWTVVWKFGLLPVSGALLAYLGTQIGVLLTGAFVSETLFQWPGMGTLLIESILKRDYPLVEATVFCTASFILIGVWIGDALQRGVDPRLRGNES